MHNVDICRNAQLRTLAGGASSATPTSLPAPPPPPTHTHHYSALFSA